MKYDNVEGLKKYEEQSVIVSYIRDVHFTPYLNRQFLSQSLLLKKYLECVTHIFFLRQVKHL